MSAGCDKLQRVATGLGIGGLKLHIFLCADQTKPKCCDRKRASKAGTT